MAVTVVLNRIALLSLGFQLLTGFVESVVVVALVLLIFHLKAVLVHLAGVLARSILLAR